MPPRYCDHREKHIHALGSTPTLTAMDGSAQTYTDIEPFWDRQRWPSFSCAEMACSHCGQAYIWPEFMDRLQTARTLSGRPFIIYSGHRCGLHNARVGGAPLSQHLKLAADIGIAGHDRHRLYQACRTAGFTGFGFYSTFLHVDLGRKRSWYGQGKAKQLWQIF